MATDLQAEATARGWNPYRLTARQFSAMIDAGIFPDDIRVELLGGVLTEPMTRNPPHDYFVGRLGKILDGLLVAPWFAREEKALILGRHWRPGPDISVLRGPDNLFDRRIPTASDVALLIEVAETSHAVDRGRKWRRHAAAKVAAYWIVILPSRRVEVYNSPAGRGRSAVYRDSIIYHEPAEVPVTIEGREVGRIAVGDILPRA